MRRHPCLRKNTTATKDRTMKTLTAAAVAAVAAAAYAPAALAIDFQAGGLHGRIDNRLSAGVAVRTQDPAADLVGIANGGIAFSTNSDDANKNFDSAGDIVSAPVKLLTDLTLTFGEFTLFARGGAGVDGVYYDGKNFRESDYGPGLEASLDELDQKRRAIRGEVGRYAEVLDLHLSASHFVANRNLSWRIGRQILNWGESTFILNGLNAILAANANRAGAPGAELEEIFIPANKLWVSMDLIENLSFEAFYQLQWEKTKAFAAGTFFSTNDFVGVGGTRANLGFGRVTENSPAGTPCAEPTTQPNCVAFGSTVPRAPDNEPGDSGQFGGALRLFLPWLNSADVGLYGTNYHSRLPLISGISRTDGTASSQTSRFIVEYPEDIQMYGVSMSMTGPFGTSVQGEYSYKIDQPLQLDDVELLLAGLGAPNQITGNVPFPVTLGNQYIRGWRRHDVSNLNASFVKLFAPNVLPGSDSLVLIGEVGIMRAHGLPESHVLRYEAPGTPLPGDVRGAIIGNLTDANGTPIVEPGQFATRTSWGYRVLTQATYNNVFWGVTLRPTLRFDHDVNGMTPLPLGNYVQGRKQIQSSVAFEYLNRWQLDLGYTVFTGGGKQNQLRDRDFAQAAIRYSF
jgi:hypothetical protein